MLKKTTKIAAFTLLEILIVITIISILSTVFITSYKGYIEHTRVDSAASEIKSVMDSIKFKSDSGVISIEDADNMSENIANCEAINFDKKTNEITTFTVKYDNQNKTCIKNIDKRSDINSVEINKDVIITELSNTETSELTIYFMPPRGNMEIFSGDKKVELQESLELQISHATYTQYIKGISIDPITSTVNIF